MTTEFDVIENGLAAHINIRCAVAPQEGCGTCSGLTALAKLREEYAEMDRLNRQAVCVYCGHVAELESRTDLQRVMAEHIATCAKHPINRIVEITEPLEQQITTLTRENERLSGELESAKEVGQELCSLASDIGIYYGEDPDSARTCIQDELAAYSKVMWTIAGILNTGSARPDDIEAAVREKFATLTAELASQRHNGALWEEKAKALTAETAQGNEGIPHAQPSSLDGENAESEISDASR